VNEQTLERLIIDEALGALPPDVGELLAAYCANTTHERERQEWQRLTLTAREALQPRATEAIPVFPVQAVRVLRFRRTAVMALSAAAALLFGIGIGVHLHLAQPSAGPVLAAQPTNASVVAPATAGVLDIWSSNRLLAVALESKREAQPQWRWSSPVDQPQIGGVR
jgi:hypothetical protein